MENINVNSNIIEFEKDSVIESNIDTLNDDFVKLDTTKHFKINNFQVSNYSKQLNDTRWVYTKQILSTYNEFTFGTTHQWRGITWSPELSIFCAVSTNSTDRVATSPDGETWTLRTSGEETSQWVTIAWSPSLGIFCALADTGFNDRCMTSSDGITWTSHTVDFTEYTVIEWIPELNLFVAGADTGVSGAIYTSPDGITFTGRVFGVGVSSIAWSPELGLLCVPVFSGFSRIPQLYTSTDGINWNLENIDVPSHIVWSPQLGIFCALETDRVSTSRDGITWVDTVIDLTYYQNITRITWIPELAVFCVFAPRDLSPTGNNITYSRNGIDWVRCTTVLNTQYFDIAWSTEISKLCIVGTSQRIALSIL